MNGYNFSRVETTETRAARVEVDEWADELYDDQVRIWNKKKVNKRPNKQRPPTIQQCRDKSREIRIRRERDATYANDTTNPYV